MMNLPSNPVRGLVGLTAIVCMVIGAGILWGIGGSLFAGGLLIAIDASSDEAIERITKTTRGTSARPSTGLDAPGSEHPSQSRQSHD